MHSPPFSMCVCSWFIRFIVYFPMQPMWLCFFLDRLFEETFENTQWRKVKQMQPMRLCFFKFENAHWYKSYECNQCDYASSQAGDLRNHLKIHSGEKSNKCNQCDYAFSRQEIWGHIWKRTLEKSQINATNATMHLLRQAIWGTIWKYTVEKSQTNATNATMLFQGRKFEDTFENAHWRKVK